MNAVTNSVPFPPDAIEVDVVEALRRQRAGAFLLDVREDDERAAGFAAASVGLPRGAIESRIAEVVPDRGREILAICASGRRSLLAVETLRALGYANSRSVHGGFARWKEEGLPVEQGELDADSAERYARHLVLPEVGVAGQRTLARSRVALIGAGGLGAPASLYLVAAGVGHLTLVDDDRVERSNLQRQVVHADARVGMHKTESARLALNALNPGVTVRTFEERLRAENVERLVRDHDVVVDGADNFPTRYLLSAASQRLGLPLVYGAVHRFSGQVSVFDPRRADSPCYRCLFPQPPSAAEAPNCSEAGVLGVLPGIVGLLQASETLKLLLGIGQPLVGRLLCHDALAGTFRELRLRRDPDCPGCGADARFTGYEDVAQICSTGG
ncbi:molybdopterin-synthase adenylyltransferase MoeB [Dokdonella sp.]|uniref:molybdopterin-synthase adenylyltransferase MoeB n=1 Tax=Dokdonella sp. TaxID=2291710 RepID=UPI0026238D9F|nr:molybdopterin-synthase adenylyltransferase MoeB [Dokdonella sp.]